MTDLSSPGVRPLLAGLDLREDLLVGEPFERGCDRRLSLALLDQIVEVFDVLKVMLPDLVDRLGDGLVPIGERDDAHRLREVGVARRADQQPVRLVARLVDARPEPGLPAVAMPEGVHLGLGRLDHRPLGLAFAAHPDLGQVAAGPPFVDPERRGGRSVVPLVDEVVPVDVADMALAAGPDEADRDDRLGLLVVVENLPFVSDDR